MLGTKSIVLLGVFYLLLVTTFSSLSYIVTYIYDHKEGYEFVGPLILATNYGTFLITNLFAPSIRLPYKTQMKIAAICYTFNYVTQSIPASKALNIFFIIIGSMVSGFGAAILWVVYGAYIKSLCKVHQEEEEEGKYFSIANMLNFSSNLFGAIITTFGIGLFSNEIYFVILIVLGLISLLYCHFLVEDIPKLDEKQEEYDCLKELKGVFSYYPRMKSLFFMMIIDGLSLAFTSTSLPRFIPATQSEQKNNLEAGICLMIFGVGTIIGGYLSGYIPTKIGVVQGGKLAILSFFICCGYTFYPINSPSLVSGFIGGFLWGVELYYLEGWLLVACSHFFNGDLQSFAIVKQFHSVFFISFQIFLIFVEEPNLNYVMLVLCLFGFPAYFLLLSLAPKKLQNELVTQNSD